MGETKTAVYLAWCSEYPEDGSTTYDAATAEEAEQRYRADTEAGAETEVSVHRVTAEDVAKMQGKIDDLRHEVHMLRKQAQSARRAALEEAAQLLEDGARVSELHARETICPQTRDRFLHLAKFERLHAEDIRALIAGAGEGETR